MLATVTASAIAASSTARSAESVVSNAPADEVGTIIVTGVRGGPQRTVANSPAPIEVISRGQLERSGNAEFGEALAKSVPSFNFVQNQAGISSIVRPISNRGLGPAYTLVLVNGKRRHNGSQLTNGSGDDSGVNPVDFDLIPLSATDTLEVLKDSAAAQYGSDAVAGVVNIRLKDAPDGGHVSYQYGSVYKGKGDLDSWRAEGDAGFALGHDGFLHVSGDGRSRGLAWFNFPSTANAYAPASNPKNATWSHDGAHNGDPAIDAYNFSYNAGLPLNDNMTLYSFSTVGHRETEIGNNYRRPNSTANFSTIFPDGYYPLNNTDEIDFQMVAGVKGSFWGWKWDLSSSWGRNRVRQYSDLSINPSLGPTSPTSFDDLATYQYQEWVQNLDITRGIDIGLSKPLQVSGGGEYRIDKFQTFAGDPLGYINGNYIFKIGDQEGNPNLGKRASIGTQAGITLAPGDEADIRRGDVAGYIDLGIYPVENWYIGLAGRVEDYDDASGTTLNGRFNSRYDIADWIAVRGTAGTGFRAPSLTQIGYAQTDNRTNLNPLTGELLPSYSKLLRNDSPLARALGAQDLKPEESWNLGVGFVLHPLERLNITLDGYQINIKDRIIRTGILTGSTIDGIAQAIDPTLPAGAYYSYFANAVDTRTRGLDLVGEWSENLQEWGRLSLNVGFNYNTTKILRALKSPAVLANTGAIYFGRIDRGYLTVDLPETKLILGAQWKSGPVTVNLQSTRYGDYDYVRSELVSQDTQYGAKWLTDLEISYNIFDGLRLTVGSTNIFDVKPDKNGPGDPNTGGVNSVYGIPPFSIDGGFYYTKISYDF